MGSTQQKGFHFRHKNINRLLSKKDEIRCIANKTKATTTEITESKLDHTVPNSKLTLPGYDILQCDRNMRVPCIAKKLKILFLIFFYRSIGVFYRPPNQADFIDLMVEKFSNLNLKVNEIYLLGDFNINHFQNGKYILN